MVGGHFLHLPLKNWHDKHGKIRLRPQICFYIYVLPCIASVCLSSTSTNAFFSGWTRVFYFGMLSLELWHLLCKQLTQNIIYFNFELWCCKVDKFQYLRLFEFIILDSLTWVNSSQKLTREKIVSSSSSRPCLSNIYASWHYNFFSTSIAWMCDWVMNKLRDHVCIHACKRWSISM